MKRTLVLLLLIACMTALAACGSAQPLSTTNGAAVTTHPVTTGMVIEAARLTPATPHVTTAATITATTAPATTAVTTVPVATTSTFVTTTAAARTTVVATTATTAAPTIATTATAAAELPEADPVDGERAEPVVDIVAG